jgi:hypothetical protein
MLRRQSTLKTGQSGDITHYKHDSAGSVGPGGVLSSGRCTGQRHGTYINNYLATVMLNSHTAALYNVPRAHGLPQQRHAFRRSASQRLVTRLSACG